MNDVAISVKNISKNFRMYASPKEKLKELLHPFGKKYHQEFWALKDVSFEVKKGECIGIIGRNGSGKSTLLQVICGVLQPSQGEVKVNGRITALLELGAGFNKNFTGRENVYMNGALMGLSKEEMDRKIQMIADFADIGQFIDQPVNTYSSGMYVRLAFACTINIDPDILIVDEALSVGDVFFQQKSFAAIRSTIQAGTTCLFVSHDTSAIMNICTSAILLNNGQVDFLGSPEEAVSRYFSKVGSRASINKDDNTKANPDSFDEDIMSPSKVIEHNILSSQRRHGARGLEIVAARVLNMSGKDTLEVHVLQALEFYVLLRAKEKIFDPSTGIHLYDRLGNLVFAAGTRQLKYALPSLDQGQELVVRMTIAFNVQPGEYTFSLGAAEPSEEGPNVGFIHDRYEMQGPIVVTADHVDVFPFYGIAQLPMTVKGHMVKRKE